MDSFNDTLRDAIALVSGHTERDAFDPLMGQVANSVVADLKAADFDDVVGAFLGITLRLVDALAARAGESPEEYWNGIAAALSGRLAELENQA